MKYFVMLGVALACAYATADPATRADSHAPIGVMGDHLHAPGEWMLSYRVMRMHMQGNRDGTEQISTADVTTKPNPFGTPPTLRVVPTEMQTDMHMFGLMYGLTDRITLMAMTSFVRREMSHTTFQGGAGSTLLGRFTTKTNGVGDTTVAALVGLGQQSGWHATLGLSLPTGDTDEADQILTPMNTTPRPRLPYPMQLGSGSTDLLSGLTYNRAGEAWGGGSQWRSLWRFIENDEDYRLGHQHEVHGWVSRLVGARTSVSARMSYRYRGNVKGADPSIRAPVQTADPNRQKHQRLELSLGANFVVSASGHRLAAELSAPLWQKVAGPQLESDWMLTLGWQFAP